MSNTPISSRIRSSAQLLYRHRLVITAAIAGVAIVGVSPVSAQSSGPVGSGICGTPLADTINQGAPLVIGVLMIGGAILSYILHNVSAFHKEPQKVQATKDWRNRAAFTSITTPLFAIVIQLFIGFTGVGLTDCVNIVPFF